MASSSTNMVSSSGLHSHRQCQVSLKTLILCEINTITSMMRKSSHGGSGSGSGSSGGGGGHGSGSASSSLRYASSTAFRIPSARTSNSNSNSSGPAGALQHLGGAARQQDGEEQAGLAKEMGLRGAGGVTSTHGAGNGSKSMERLNRSTGSATGGKLHNLSHAHSLLEGFATLRAELREIEDPYQLDALVLLSPFLDVVRSGDTSGPITSCALSSIDKFITYSVIHRNSPNLSLAMSGVAGAGTHCRFEASNDANFSDEVVLLKILDVLRNTLTTGELGETLSDEAVCEMMETGLSMCCQMRLSEMLRRSAERTMQAMIHSVFRRLQNLPVPSREPEQDAQTAANTVTDTDPSSSSLHEQTGTQTPKAEDPTLRMVAPDPTSGSIPAASTPVSPTFKRSSSYGFLGSNVITNSTGTAGARTPERSRPGSPTTAQAQQEAFGDSIDEVPAQPAMKPYGLPSIREILRVLISLLNPHDLQHTESMRLMALGLLNVALEIGGASIAQFPVLREMVKDELCKYLFQLARSENSAILAMSLRVISNLSDTMREHLKLQQELFLSFLMDRLIRPPPGSASNLGASVGGTRKGELESELDASTWNIDDSPAASTLSPGNGGIGPQKHPHSGVSTPVGERRGSGASSSAGGHQGSMRGDRTPVYVSPQAQEARELMLEYLAQFARAPDFMTNLWVNYDCNVDCEDLYERLIKFFSRGVYPSGLGPQYIQDNSQFLCLDTLLTFVNFLSNRVDQPTSPSIEYPSLSSPDSIDPEALAFAKASKRNMLEGAVRFNVKPKDGLAFLESKGLIFTDENAHLPRAQAMAMFLKNNPRLDKKLLGDYISRPDNAETLKAFIELFDFSEKVISDAMRELLESFRLPGEAQQIDRITETFAKVYVAANPVEVKTSDAAYVLAFSIIMLNTDLHSPQVRKRMTFEDYSKNLKGVNDGADFSVDYLRAVYDGIRKREIVMPEEHVGQLGFEYAWGELLRRARSAGPFLISDSSEFDRSIFTLSWKPVISALSYAFTHFTDDYMLQRAISGFQQCALLANRFGLPEVFDYTIHSLAKITGLPASQVPLENTTTFPTIDIDGQTVTVSPLALKFGTSFKAQLAAVVLFSIANDNTSAIRMSWVDIFEIYQTLFTYSLLPQSLLNMAEFLAGAPAIPLKVRIKPAVPEQRRNDGGLLSTLSSYLLSPYANGSEGIGRDVTDDDVEHTLSTIDCIGSCRVDSLYHAIIDLPADALGPAVTTLVDLTERLTLDKIRHRPLTGLQNNNEPPSPASSGRIQVPYEPSTVFMLELLMSIAGEAENAVQETWPTIFEFVSKLLANGASFHHILLERAVTGLLRVASHVAREESLHDQLFLALDALRTLPAPIMGTLSDQIASGLSQILQANPNVIKSTTEWNLVFALWCNTAVKEDAAAVSFDQIGRLAAGQLGGGLNADNFVGFIRVLNDFANLAGQGDVRLRNSPQGINDPVQLRGRRALDMIREAQSLANDLITQSSMNATAAWEAYWLPVLTAYSQQSVNGCRTIRQTAMANLQRTLIAYEVLSNAEVDLIMVFEKLIFPMLDELLKPQVFRRDPEGMGETRLRATAVLCKIFLHYLIQLSERQGMAGMTELWMRILGYLDRFMHSGRRDQMYEAVPESLKNVLLVMHASGFLLPPHQPRSEEKAALWDATFDRLDIFLPSLRQELFPAPASVRQSQLSLQPAPTRSPSPSPALGTSIPDQPSSGKKEDSSDVKDPPSQSISSVYM